MVGTWLIETPDPTLPCPKEYFPLPPGRRSSFSHTDPDLPSVCVLGIGPCSCSLINAFILKDLIIPGDMQEVDVWASDSNTRVGKGDYRYRMYKQYFPAYLEEIDKKVGICTS